MATKACDRPSFQATSHAREPRPQAGCVCAPAAQHLTDQHFNALACLCYAGMMKRLPPGIDKVTEHVHPGILSRREHSDQRNDTLAFDIGRVQNTKPPLSALSQPETIAGPKQGYGHTQHQWCIIRRQVKHAHVSVCIAWEHGLCCLYEAHERFSSPV